MKRFLLKITAFLTVFCVFCGFSGDFRAFSANFTRSSQNIVYINDAEGFFKLAEECRIDSASRGLTVTLQADIDLGGADFGGIPIFCGTFNGGGYTISGLSVRGSLSETGLFRHLERGAVVKNLTVSGVVSPSGSRDMIGGIAGVNRGTITSCAFRGTVSGNASVGGIAGKNEETGVVSSCTCSAIISAESSAGGITGTNLGVLLDCSNSGNVNAVYTENNSENLENFEDFEQFSAENVIGSSDIGGIAGYSSGIIQRCSNSGVIGYQHVGYNVGGIVGRQNGMLQSCKNSGQVFGRKDVGGIAGQMEPYRSIEFSEDTVQRLGEEMDNLSEYVDKLISDARGSGNRLDSEVQTLTSQMNAAQKNADTIFDRAESVFNGYSSGINELLSRADIALDGAIPALNALDEALGLLGDFSDKCSEALRELESAGAQSSEAARAAREALNEIDKALPSLESGFRDIANALRTAQKSLGDSESVKRTLVEITESLDGITGVMKAVSDAAKKLNATFGELSEWLDSSDWRALRRSVTAFSDSLEDVLSALGEVSSAVGDIAGAVDSGEMSAALAEINSASASLGRAAAKLAAAIQNNGGTLPDRAGLQAAADELQKAADELQSASEHLTAAVDPDEMQKALDDLQNASRKLENALNRASSAAGDMSAALDKIMSSDVPENTRSAVSQQLEQLLGALGNIADELSEVNRQVRSLLDEIDAAGLSSALNMLADAAESIANAADAVGEADGSVDSAVKSLGEALDSLSAASSSAADAAEIMSRMSDKLSDAMKQLQSVTETLAGEPEVRFPALDETFTSAADDLSANMEAMISTLLRISSAANSELGALLDDVQAVNDCLSRIFDIFKDTYRDLLSDEEKERGFSEDVSENESAEPRSGSAYNCLNSGSVEGDVNVGGITGCMAIEFDLDPEDDIALSGDRSINFSYNVMDIIENCENQGAVTAKKNYCGGIVGKMDMGLVRNSRSSGAVISSSGSYVGGIAGYSSAKVRSCVSKVSLAGSAYIGGIAGEGGIITDCLTIAEITDFTEKIGAVAGYADFTKKNAEISGNFFVDRGIAAIDRVSYAGAAEPISYEGFAARTGSFADITVEFTANGESLLKLTVPYGGSINASEIPEIPPKSGYYARWEEFDFDNVTFPQMLVAEYVELLTSIASDKTSERGLPLVLADGSFDDAAALRVETESSSVFPPSGSELRIVTIDVGKGAAPDALRFLKTGENSSLMQYVNGAWKAVSFTENGSYLIVDSPALESGGTAFCVSSGTANFAAVAIAAAAGAVLIIAAATIVLLKKHSRRKKKQHN
ncbi:MAG: hypothetical protein NC299_15000 [Lachnospiraceae bacterium]|nr:hypothetical protein [Ruminococcus sp.]MCM1276644.1 hypothetical protein [Lachnospiraceae bacterium]